MEMSVNTRGGNDRTTCNGAKRIKIWGGGVKKEEEEANVIKAESRDSMEWETLRLWQEGRRRKRRRRRRGGRRRGEA